MNAARSLNSRLLRHAAMLLVMALIAFFPLLLMFAAAWVARLADCALDEGGAHPCVILGSDRGEMLYNMFAGGWLTILTLPLAALLFIAWVIVLIARAMWLKS